MDPVDIPVRTALMPLCYKDFHCLMGACRDNCCAAGWEIAFNKKDYLRIKRAVKSRELKAALSGGVSRLRDDAFNGFYAHFATGPEGRCAFQREDGLCRLQLECGAEALPMVCRMYPRKITYTPAAREFSLSPSCEGVLEQLWNLPQGIDFWEEDLPRADWQTIEAQPRSARFADIRSFCIDVMQERSLPLSRRMLLLGVLLQRLKETDWAEEGAVDGWLAWGGEQLRDPAAAALESLPRDRLGFLTGGVRVLLNLYENHRPGAGVYRSLFAALSADGEDWEKNGIGKFSMDTVRYQELENRLEELLGHSDAFFENLMVMTAFYLAFPLLSGPEELWRSYVDLCMLYGFCRFAAVCACGQEAGRERLFQVLVAAGRGLLHNKQRRDWLVRERLARGEGTLAHMAVLLGG